jgi:hypothetical protein
MEGAAQVDADLALPCFFGHALERRDVIHDSCIVHQHVDVTKRVAYRRHAALDRGGIGNVEDGGSRAPSERLDLSGGLRDFGQAIGHRDDRTFFGQHQRRGAADSASGTGHQRKLSFEQHAEKPPC